MGGHVQHHQLERQGLIVDLLVSVRLASKGSEKDAPSHRAGAPPLKAERLRKGVAVFAGLAPSAGELAGVRADS